MKYKSSYMEVFLSSFFCVPLLGGIRIMAGVFEAMDRATPYAIEIFFIGFLLLIFIFSAIKDCKRY